MRRRAVFVVMAVVAAATATAGSMVPVAGGVAAPVVTAQPAVARVAAVNPPVHPVKLVFVHHSVGENWLSDDQGRLAAALQRNHYFVSDTNYGWGPGSIGDRTDIPDWSAWFRGRATPAILRALFAERRVHSPFTRTIRDPGGPNQIVMFKSCFPNSSLSGRPTDRAAKGNGLTVANAKYVYNRLLPTFAARPGKLFVVITAPPNSDSAHAANARAFNNWLVRDWLDRYRLKNVAVFDFYNVLTGPRNHHRLVAGRVQHVYTPGMNTTYYPSDDDHPNVAGSRKATSEFVPMLNLFYSRWQRSR